MKRTKLRFLVAGGALFALTSYYIQAQEPAQNDELAVEHANCSFFSAKRDDVLKAGLMARKDDYGFSRVAMEVAARLPVVSSKDARARSAESNNVIDKNLAQVWRDNGVTPANLTNDFEFIRRVSLDLTGRIPTAVRVQSFINDADPDKRGKLVNELLNSPLWVDKWTMYYGDLYKNAVRTATGVVRFNEGRNGFYLWIKDALTQNKPYNAMVTELITADGDNSYTDGRIGWIVGGAVTGGPVQDLWDQMAVNSADMFLGISHMNCVMCHDGRRHLDTLTLWGKSATRLQAYQLSSFFAKTELKRVRVEPTNPQNTNYYYDAEDNVRYRTDYALNTTSGNRPNRTTVGTLRNVAPEYPFNGNKPAAGENYRVALARNLTGDFQFARATVNYIWKEFMTKAFVEPVNMFDPARLDPDNPPPDPWTLQPNQPRLLNELAQNFIDNKYDLKALMRTIVLSDAYQLSSRYDGKWNPAWENMYARHLPRRMWAEEIHDAVVQATNVIPAYNVPGIGTVNWAMKLPDVRNVGNSEWLDSFYRGNRDTEDRRPDGSTLQVLNLMNDAFVMNKTRQSGTGETASLLRKALTGTTTDEQLVSMLYINVLSRYPNDQEKAAAYAALKDGVRTQRAEDLLWALLNKVDFFFNY